MNNHFPTGIEQQAQQFSPPQNGDEKLFVQFYLGSVQNMEKTEAEGHPVFDAKPFVKIMTPGDKNTVIDTTVDATHKRRWSQLWHQFENQQTQVMSGMPVREWPAITRAQAEELFHMNIYTVEQLATMADVYGSKIMGFQDLRRKAVAYVEQAKDAAYAQKMNEENAALKGRISQLEGDLKTLSERFEDVLSTKGGKKAEKEKF